LAEAYGAIGLRATSPEEVDGVIDKAMGIDDRPCVIDFRVDPGEMCFPMVPAGATNDEIIVAPGITPGTAPSQPVPEEMAQPDFSPVA
ncbi:MAG: hypothetical protein H0U16_00770, partial [Actinobacteria bacterium]|nr:hypothetical protein [Actinomycetota bacterium]